MANIKISDLTAASVAAGANEFEINEAGTSKKVTGTQIAAYVEGTLGLGSLATLSAVGTSQITDGSVTAAKIGTGAVTEAKLASDSVTAAKIAANAVGASEIASNAVGADELNVTGNGTAGQYLASDGDGTMTWTTLAAGGGFSDMDVFTSPGTWTNPGNIEKVKVTVVGGGGSGVNGYPGSNITSGGAGGAAIEVIPFPSGTNVSVTVGNAGGTSSFGAYCSATGGSSGAHVNNNPAQGIKNGGSGSGGQINIQGGPGQGSAVEPARELMAGGASIFGGRGYGSGGYSTGDYPPGTPAIPGRPGIVIVEY